MVDELILKYKKMKNIKYIGLFLATLFIAWSCTEQDVDEVLEIDHTGGLLEVHSTSLGYVVGDNGTYEVKLTAAHGSSPTNKIEVYNTYTNNLGESSNTVLIKTIDLTKSGITESVSFSVMYEDLIAGIVFNDAPLSPVDSDLSIGDGFNLTYVSTTDQGFTSSSAAKTKLTVSTRFAGKYRAIKAEYFRIGVATYTEADWPAVTTIESVDAKTYRVVEYFGAFNGNEWYFQVDADLNITYPDEWDGKAQEGNGQPFITCGSNPTDMVNVDCDTSNYIELDNVNGKDKLYMTFGYLTAGSGPREFYQVLEKIVE